MSYSTVDYDQLQTFAEYQIPPHHYWVRSLLETGHCPYKYCGSVSSAFHSVWVFVACCCSYPFVPLHFAPPPCPSREDIFIKIFSFLIFFDVAVPTKLHDWGMTFNNNIYFPTFSVLPEARFSTTICSARNVNPVCRILLL